MLGYIIDFISGSLRWGVFTAIGGSALGLILLSDPIRRKLSLGLDQDVSGILRITILAVIFFIECSTVAWLMVA